MREAKRNGSYEPTGISQPSGNIKYKRHSVRPAGCACRRLLASPDACMHVLLKTSQCVLRHKLGR